MIHWAGAHTVLHHCNPFSPWSIYPKYIRYSNFYNVRWWMLDGGWQLLAFVASRMVQRIFCVVCFWSGYLSLHFGSAHVRASRNLQSIWQSNCHSCIWSISVYGQCARVLRKVLNGGFFLIQAPNNTGDSSQIFVISICKEKKSLIRLIQRGWYHTYIPETLDLTYVLVWSLVRAS